jgi:prepilin-type N-terminal cleavage/methylation domain-containing protein
MQHVRRLRRRLAAETGFTLIEMVTALAILLIVLGGLTTMFHAGMNAEVKAMRELQAQQEARLALDRIRRELHCASEITGAPNGTAVASVTVTLPAACPGAHTSVTYATVSVATNRWRLTRTVGATTMGVADYLTSSTPFTYYVPASGTLGRLVVDIQVNVTPTDPNTLWRLQDDIVLRNTSRL